MCCIPAESWMEHLKGRPQNHSSNDHEKVLECHQSMKGMQNLPGDKRVECAASSTFGRRLALASC